MVAGSREPAVQSLKKTLAALGGVAESTVYFGDERMPAPDNGLAAEGRKGMPKEGTA